MSNNVMAITVGRRFDYDDVKFKHFVRLLNENITNAASTGPMNAVPFLAKQVIYLLESYFSEMQTSRLIFFVTRSKNTN
jgi:hypothetical protein